MTGPPQGGHVLVVGRGGRIARAVTIAARDAGAIAVGTLAVAITNGAADTLARSLALELAPTRVDAISPGVIDTGAWDALGEQGKAGYFASMRARNPARRRHHRRHRQRRAVRDDQHLPHRRHAAHRRRRAAHLT